MFFKPKNSLCTVRIDENYDKKLLLFFFKNTNKIQKFTKNSDHSFFLYFTDYRKSNYEDTPPMLSNNNNTQSNNNPSNFFPAVEAYRRSNNNNSNTSSNNMMDMPAPPQLPLQPMSMNQPSSTFNGYYSAPLENTMGGGVANKNFDYYQPKTSIGMPPSPRNNDPNEPRRDIRFDVDMTNKQAYKRALDQQVAEKEIMKYNFEKEKIKSERDSLKQYPFGRRTDLSSLVMPVPDEVPAPYEPSFYNNNTRAAMPSNPLEQPMRFLNKDNIVEKPNSLSADIPPYDPIKHRNGFHQGFDYDPWGKPGGGGKYISFFSLKILTRYT